MSKKEWIGLKKSQRKFISQLVEYMKTEDVFSKKDSFDILSYQKVPGLPGHHSSTMAVRYVLKPTTFIEGLEDILKKGYYTEDDKSGLSIVREKCKDGEYPFQDFSYDPSKKLKKNK